MKISEKLDCLLTRKRISRSDFAKSVGITYRALYYYLNGDRKPRKEILNRMAEQLGVTPEFLSDNNIDIELSAEDKLLKTLMDNGRRSTGAIRFVEETKGLFAGNSISDKDKELLIECLNEIYLDSRKEKP